MSRVSDMIKQLKENDELGQKFEAAKKQIKAQSKEKTDEMIFVEAAKSLGYDISIEELAEELVDEQELSADELEKVSGGWTSCDRSFNCIVNACWTSETEEDCSKHWK